MIFERSAIPRPTKPYQKEERPVPNSRRNGAHPPPTLLFEGALVLNTEFQLNSVNAPEPLFLSLNRDLSTTANPALLTTPTTSNHG